MHNSTIYHKNKSFTRQSSVFMTLMRNACQKHCGKRRKCWKPAFSPFLTVFSSRSKTVGAFKICHSAFSLAKYIVLSSVAELTLSAQVFTSVQYKSLENTVGRGEIVFHSVFSTHLDNFLQFFIKLKNVVYKLFQFGRVYNLTFGKGLKKLSVGYFTVHL